VGDRAAKAADLLDVVFTLADDLGCRDCGCSGSTIYDTPAIDGLAREGIRFTAAQAASPVCSPTRASSMSTWRRGRRCRGCRPRGGSPAGRPARGGSGIVRGADSPPVTPLRGLRLHRFRRLYSIAVRGCRMHEAAVVTPVRSGAQVGKSCGNLLDRRWIRPVATLGSSPLSRAAKVTYGG